MRHLEAPGPKTAPDQSAPRGEDEEAEGRGRDEGREDKEKKGEARQGVQARSSGGEGTARHARVLGGGRGGGLGRRGPRSEGDGEGASPPPFYLWDEEEGATVAPEEPRAAGGSLANLSLEGAAQGSSSPAAGEGSLAPQVLIRGNEAAAGEESSALAASSHRADMRGAPSGQSSRDSSMPRARRTATKKRSMSARSG